ncbi:MAG: ComEC/Rec2 family competence protein [Spirochaetaceae bacterium]|jgi:competence protein ComEC|nr:ComEC/Rec2 family competence protein [Spirochaetaceae bacterium]
MVAVFIRSPVVYTVFGALGSYYGLAGLYLPEGSHLPWMMGGALVLGILIALFRALGDGPEWFFSERKSRYCFRKTCRYVTALAVGFFLGFTVRTITAASELKLGLPRERVLGITGTLLDDPRAFSDGRGMGYLKVSGASGIGGIRTSARGRVLVFFPAGAIPRLKEFGRAAPVYVEGSFIVSPNNGGKGFQTGIPLFRAGSVFLLGAAPPVEQFRTGIRMEVLEKFAHSAWGGLASALILGVKDNLDSTVSELFRTAGCSHVLALSGMHLAIVSALIAFLLKKPLGLRAAALAGSFFILLYVYLVGPQPSLVRAAIMYLLGTAAVLGAFPRQPVPLLGLAFLIQIVLDPSSGDSLSFILSYLALGGILIAGEAIHDLIRGKVPELLAGPLSASLGAFIATAAVSAAAFGVIRPGGIGAGLGIVPLSTLFMILAIVYLGISFLLPPLAGLLDGVLSGLYELLGGTAFLASRIPGVEGVSPAVLGGISLVLVLGLLSMQNHFALLRGKIAPLD